jgi:hypothetical protein
MHIDWVDVFFAIVFLGIVDGALLLGLGAHKLVRKLYAKLRPM